MKIGCMSTTVRVVSWIEICGFRVGARVVVSADNLVLERFRTVRSNLENNLSFGDSLGIEKLVPGVEYLLSMYELLKFGDREEFDFKFKNCYLSNKIIDYVDGRPVISFVDRGNIPIGIERYDSGFDRWDFSKEENQSESKEESIKDSIEESVEETSHYGISLTIE